MELNPSRPRLLRRVGSAAAPDRSALRCRPRRLPAVRPVPPQGRAPAPAPVAEAEAEAAPVAVVAVVPARAAAQLRPEALQPGLQAARPEVLQPGLQAARPAQPRSRALRRPRV